MLQFFVTLRAGSPIYEQVVMAVKKAILQGQLQVGQSFPSVRDLSKELSINPNTAQKVVAKLIQEKLLEVRPGIGTVIIGGGTPNQEQISEISGQRLEQLVIEAKTVGVSEKQFLESTQKYWKLGNKKVKL